MQPVAAHLCNMAFLTAVPLPCRSVSLRSSGRLCVTRNLRIRAVRPNGALLCMSEKQGSSSRLPEFVSTQPAFPTSEKSSAVGSHDAHSRGGGSDHGSGGDKTPKMNVGAVSRGVLVGFSAAFIAAIWQHDWLAAHRDLAIIAVFLAGYGSIILEASIDINKAAPALLMSAGIWTTLLSAASDAGSVFEALNGSILEVAQILLFLAGAMSTVEIMDGHDAFRIITDRLPRASKRQLLWAITVATFLLSSVLDDLTTTIVMLSLVRKIIPDDHREDRLLFGGSVVIAANAGGAWSPIGDVTTTLIWQHGNISVIPTIVSLFLPSVACMLGGLALITPQLKDGPVLPSKGQDDRPDAKQSLESGIAFPKPPGSELVFWAGIGALLFVPAFKTYTGVPPFFAMALSLGFMWSLTDVFHAGRGSRDHLRAEHLVKRVDINSLTFFLGILLTMGGLQSAGVLEKLSHFLDSQIPSRDIVAALIGISSAVVDNVALVAATLGMWNLQDVPVDAATWQQVAFCAGTGGSMLSIGSASGVTLMVTERVSFGEYLRKISLPAAVGFFGGFATFLALNAAGLASHGVSVGQ